MNILQVARRARVSTATVSRVINGKVFVTPETADRVRNAIRELNFYPDTNARTLGSGRSGLYGLIISDITNPYFPELVKAFEDIVVEHGQEVLIANTNYDPQRMRLCVTRMLQRKVDGVAIMTSEMDDTLIQSFTGRGVPIVVTDAQTKLHEVDVVRLNYEAGVRAAMQHLFVLRHKRIAFISGPLSLSSARTRAQVFRQVLEQHGQTDNPLWIQEGDHRVEGGHRAMLRILESKARPTAVLASNDLSAIGAMGAIHEHGLRIPEDISVIGFDGIELSAYAQPALTTIQIPRGEVAAVAFRSLLQRQQSPTITVGQEHLIETKLLIRHSTAVAHVVERSAKRLVSGTR